MAVVVQQMVFPDAAGIMFTADPVSSNRKVVSVEAGFGLGEALVSGLVNPDTYQVRDGEVVAKAVGTKRARHPRSAGRRDAGTGDRAGPTGAAGADGRAGRAARGAGPADRGALRPPPGHRVVPGRRRLPDRPEPADHHAVPHPRGRRPGEPRLHLRRSPADDDRRHEAPRALLLADDDPPADGRGRREAVRRRHPGTGFARKPREPPGPHGEVRSADQGRGPDHPRSRRLRPVAPGRRPRLGAARRRPGPDHDRSGHRRRADRAQPGLHRHVEARHPDVVRIGAPRLHPGGHPGAAAPLVRSAEPSGVHGGDRGQLVAQRAAAGVAGREERGRHAHAVRPRQRHVRDGAGAPGRRGRDPPASGRGGVPAARRGRGLPRRDGRARGRASIARRHPGLARHVRHALRRRDRHHAAALERAPHHARAPDPRPRQELRGRAPAGGASSRDGRRRGRRNRSCCSACGPCRTGSGRPKRPSR